MGVYSHIFMNIFLVGLSVIDNIIAIIAIAHMHLTLRGTDDRLNGTPLSGYKTTAMAHLRLL